MEKQLEFLINMFYEGELNTDLVAKNLDNCCIKKIIAVFQNRKR